MKLQYKNNSSPKLYCHIIQSYWEVNILSDLIQEIHVDSHQDKEDGFDLNHQDESINEDLDKSTSIKDHDA